VQRAVLDGFLRRPQRSYGGHVGNVAVIYLPKALAAVYPILATVPQQLFAHHIALARGCDVDKPRNLAKSVTVE
jgi:glucosamine 6-phosphate synthetase-like amidotransferase/phosphosugar isomerase protein